MLKTLFLIFLVCVLSSVRSETHNLARLVPKVAKAATKKPVISNKKSVSRKVHKVAKAKGKHVSMKNQSGHKKHKYATSKIIKSKLGKHKLEEDAEWGKRRTFHTVHKQGIGQLEAEDKPRGRYTKLFLHHKKGQLEEDLSVDLEEEEEEEHGKYRRYFGRGRGGLEEAKPRILHNKQHKKKTTVKVKHTKKTGKGQKRKSTKRKTKRVTKHRRVTTKKNNRGKKTAPKHLGSKRKHSGKSRTGNKHGIPHKTKKKNHTTFSSLLG